MPTPGPVLRCAHNAVSIAVDPDTFGQTSASSSTVTIDNSLRLFDSASTGRCGGGMCDAHPIFNGWGSHGQCVRTRILFLVLSGSGDSIIAFCLLYLTPVGDKFCHDERCHVSFSSNSIIFSLCFIMLLLCFIMLLLCFHYAFIMLPLCFHYAFLGTRLIKVSFFGDITYLRTIFQIRGFLCLPVPHATLYR